MTGFDLYDQDILLWSKQQAALLRSTAAGQRLNEEPDWPHVIGEIESIGRSQLSAVRYLLVQALLHDLKAAAWPNSPDAPQWRAEARGFREDAAEALTPSMRHQIDVAALYRRALDRVPDTIDGVAPLPVPSNPASTVDEILAGAVQT